MLYYLVTSKQFKKLEKDFKPRYMNDFEEAELQKFYDKLIKSFKK